MMILLMILLHSVVVLASEGGQCGEPLERLRVNSLAGIHVLNADAHSRHHHPLHGLRREYLRLHDHLLDVFIP